MLDMKRREFITGLGGAAMWPLAARAQQRGKPAQIGYLSAASAPDYNLESFRGGMRALGYVEGRDFVIEVRYARRDYSRFPALVEELLRARVDLIVAGGPASRAAPLAGASVPVVFGFSGDPVDAGIVASFARPGGNATGVSFLALDLSVKRIDLLKEAKPTMTRVAVLSNPDHAGDASELRQRARRRTRLDSPSSISKFGPMTTSSRCSPRSRRASATGCSRFLMRSTNFNRQKIVAFALRRRLPSIYGWKIYVEAGGLMSYGPVLYDAFARLAVYVDKILKGAKPADLPVEQPTKLEMVINLKTAKAIGLELPTADPARRRPDRMKRRQFITWLGGAAMWPLAARAQQPDRMRRIGVLMNSAADDPESQVRLAAFVQELQRLGWITDRNVQIEARWSAADASTLRRHAAELAALAPDAILAGVGGTVAPLLEATRTVPIVFAQAIDPVGTGFVASLARPGGNVTGFTQFEYSLAGKWPELIKEVAPRVRARGDPAENPPPPPASGNGRSSKPRHSRLEWS